MSANNQLIILNNNGIEVHINYCVDNKFKPSNETLLKKFDSLKQAIKYANKYCYDEMIEYSYYIDESCLC